MIREAQSGWCLRCSLSSRRSGAGRQFLPVYTSTTIPALIGHNANSRTTSLARPPAASTGAHRNATPHGALIELLRSSETWRGGAPEWTRFLMCVHRSTREGPSGLGLDGWTLVGISSWSPATTPTPRASMSSIHSTASRCMIMMRSATGTRASARGPTVTGHDLGRRSEVCR